MKTKFFKYEVLQSTLVLIFESPKTSNAFGIQEAREFQKIIQQLRASHKDIRGLIVTSEQKVFCSGGHLKDYAKGNKKSLEKTPQATNIKINRELTHILQAFQKLSLPTVALVSGDCFGGGIEWLSAFDQVYAAPSVVFGMWQRKLSLTWGWGGGQRLKLRMPKKQLLNLLLEARTLSSYEALEAGLIDKIYPRELLALKALQYLKRQYDLPQFPLKAIKENDFKKEQKIFEKLWWNPEHQEVLKKYR